MIGLLVAVAMVSQPLSAGAIHPTMETGEAAMHGDASDAFLRPIVLQLAWHHQFQFAGYYAAVAKGYYRDAGFQVTLLEGRPGLTPTDRVVAGEADYAVGRSSVLLHRMHGKPVVVLACIFQHSANIFLAKRDSGIHNPQDMIGRRVMMLEGDDAAEYLAMFRSEGVPLDKIRMIPSSFDINDLIENRTDVFNAYSTNEPFYLISRKIPFTIIDPKNYGIDFYGDCLFTSEREIERHPQAVADFREASLHGWQYAMAHPEEIIDLIRKTYGTSKSRAHLRFEAQAIQRLMLPDLVEIGHINPGRWQHIADTYIKLGMADKGISLAKFIYNAYPQPNRWAIGVAVLLALGGGIGAILLFFHNRRLRVEIEGRKDAEERATRFSDLLDASLNEIYIFAADTLRFVKVNRGACQNLGYSVEEMLMMTPLDIKPDFTPESFDELVAPLRSGEKEKIQFSTIHRRKDGSLYPVEAHVQLASAGDPLFVAIMLDITERQAAEKALLKAAQEWQKTFDANSNAIWILDRHQRVQRANKAAERLFQQSGENMRGQICWRIAHGTDRPVDACPFLKAQKSLHRETMDLQIGDDWFEVAADPILDADGHFTGAVHIVNNISERVRSEREREKIQAQFMQAQKMESVGRLAGGVAHDYNNMLSVIMGYTELALEKTLPDDALHMDLREIMRAAKRSADITRQLLAFARQQTVAPRVLDLNETIESMLKMLRRLIGEDIDLVWQPKADIWPINIDPSQVDQILANLCVNARDAITDVGRISIATDTVSFDQDDCAVHKNISPGDFVRLMVSDDGCGMDQATLENIFEPFFTTKEMGKGTGLGLATVYGIVKQNDGFINVYSEPDKGTTFKIYLPRDTSKVMREDRAAPTTTPLGNGETILLVEDDASILKLSRRMLENLGYTVIATNDPIRALALGREHAGQVDLLITDVVMPAMNGRDLSHQLNPHCPGLKTLFMSGYTADVIAHRGVLDDKVCFIPKPFSKQALAAKVREVLESDTA
ncbi:hypothetical protein JCM12296A_07170 [Desulfosarcina cetonica]